MSNTRAIGIILGASALISLEIYMAFTLYGTAGGLGFAAVKITYNLMSQAK